METNWAAEHLQTIRTLMERSALYRGALAPIMTFNGVLGIAGAAAALLLKLESSQAFILFWAGIGLAGLAGSFLLVRRQALKDQEPFWSPPSRRVAQALVPAFFTGAVAGVLSALRPGWEFIQPSDMPAFWMVLYGCALNAAGFFTTRGIRLFGWVFVLCGCGLMISRGWAGGPLMLTSPNLLMGGAFGGLHLACGVYLYFTEKEKNAA